MERGHPCPSTHPEDTGHTEGHGDCATRFLVAAVQTCPTPTRTSSAISAPALLRGPRGGSSSGECPPFHPPAPTSPALPQPALHVWPRLVCPSFAEPSGKCPLLTGCRWLTSPPGYTCFHEVLVWACLAPERDLFSAFWHGPLPTQPTGQRPWQRADSRPSCSCWKPQALPRLLAVSCHLNWLQGKSMGWGVG